MFKTSTLLAIILLALAPLAFCADKAAAPAAKPMDAQWQKMNDEVIALIQKKDMDKALEKSQEIVKFLEDKGLGKGPEAATTFNNLGMIYLQKSNLGMASQYLTNALTLRTEIFGENHPDTAVVLKNLSYLNQLMSQYFQARAAEFAKRAEKILGPEEEGAKAPESGKDEGSRKAPKGK